MKILMIALHYHGYTAGIAEELRLLGHEVVLHDIMPRDTATKTLRVLAPKAWQARIDAHHRRIIYAERGKAFDLVFFIQAHQMSAANMAALKTEFSGARFILYNWDSIANHDYLPHRAAFDDIFTFDPDDAAPHGLHYLPLFCSREFQGLRSRDEGRGQVYFVGNVVNPVRYDRVMAFRAYCEAEGLPFETFLACTPPVRMKMILSGRSLKGLDNGHISRGRFLDMIERSAATFDFANHHQSGYTMRVIENLCAGKKIITTNPRVLDEPFYSPDRFHVFSDEDFEGVADFVRTPLADPAADFPEYHIQSFVQHLLDGLGHAIPQRQAA